MSGSETYLVDIHGNGEPVDLMPLAREILETCPYKNDLTPLDLAQLAEKHGNGKYIPVDVQDRVSGRRLHVLIRRVMSWAREPKRIEQLRDHDVRKLMPYVALEIDREFCPRAKKMSGRILAPDELQPIPLRGCWRSTCWCIYRSYTPEEAARKFPKQISNPDG